MGYRCFLIYIFASAFCALTLACGLEELTPRYKNGIEAINSQLTSYVSYSALKISAARSSTSGERTSVNLDVIITDAQIKDFNKDSLAALSVRISTTVKANITNLNNYDWLSITFLRSDGNNPSDSTTDNTYVFRPTEIK